MIANAIGAGEKKSLLKQFSQHASHHNFLWLLEEKLATIIFLAKHPPGSAKK
jgi:hypothetical protein